MFSRKLASLTSLQVLSVRESNGARVRPLPMNTVTMLKLASRSLGLGPKEATVYAERLYLKGYISYPRTETSAYPEHYDLLFVANTLLTTSGAVERQRANPRWGGYVASLIAEGLRVPRRGVDAGDHPPITPMVSVDPATLPSGESALYDLIATHFLATVSDGGCAARLRCRLQVRHDLRALRRRRRDLLLRLSARDAAGVHRALPRPLRGRRRRRKRGKRGKRGGNHRDGGVLLPAGIPSESAKRRASRWRSSGSRSATGSRARRGI